MNMLETYEIHEEFVKKRAALYAAAKNVECVSGKVRVGSWRPPRLEDIRISYIRNDHVGVDIEHYPLSYSDELWYEIPRVFFEAGFDVARAAITIRIDTYRKARQEAYSRQSANLAQKRKAFELLKKELGV